MLNTIIRSSLQNRLLVLVLGFMALAYSIYSAMLMPIDVFPDLDRPRVIILTECPGLATEEAEALVAQPIENAILGATGVQAVRSQTTAGLNVLFVEFGWETEIRAARQIVQERLATLSGILPEGIKPQMTPPSSIMGQIVVAGLYQQRGPTGGRLVAVPNTEFVAEYADGKGDASQVRLWLPVDRRDPKTWEELRFTVEDTHRDSNSISSDTTKSPLVVTINGRQIDVPPLNEVSTEMEFRTIADWVVRPRLLKVTGVAEVFIQGGARKQYQVLVDPSALIEFGVTLTKVTDAIKASNINTSGGFALEGETERPIRILGRLGPGSQQVLQDLGNIPVKTGEKRAVLLSHIARIVEGPQLKRGDGFINGQPGVVFTIAKQPHADTRQLTAQIEKALEEVETTLPPGVVINSKLFRLKDFIDRGVFNVAESLVIGAGLVFVILFLFLLNVRTTFITLTAIPLSLVVTTIVFRLIGFLSGTQISINVMTLGGLAVAMGELVDDAIVDVENIFRRLNENRAKASPKSTLRVIYDASCEIRSSVVFGTAVVILVFLPLFALSGVEGRLFAPLGVAYIVSILASLLVSMSITPVLAYYLLGRVQTKTHTSESWLLRACKAVAERLVRFSIRFGTPLLLLTWICVGISAWQFAKLGKNFLPQFDEGSIQINVNLPPGASLDASNLVSGIIDSKIRSMQRSEANPEGTVLDFVRRTGRAEMDEHASPVNSGEYILRMNPETEQRREELIDRLLHDLREEAPGVDIEVEQPLAHLISHMVSGVYAQIAIKIHGDDLNTLQRLSQQAKRAIETIPGVTPPVIEPIQQTDELHVQLRAEDLAFHGLTRAYVAQIVQTALHGDIVSHVLEGQRRFDLLVRLEDSYRTDYANLGRLRIDLPDGDGQIELQELADVGLGSGPNAVNRDNARRRMVIRCNTQGRDLASTVQEIQRTLSQSLELPAGYFVEYGGQFENQQRSTMILGFLACVAAIAIFVVLMILFPSVRIVLQILNALPTAFIGGVAALILTHQTLSVASLVGFISLGGIAVRNGILLVTHYLHLMREEGETFDREMIVRGSLERLAPVLMTALTAGIALVPLVLGGLEPGREILYPVATVILGGLITSTFCEFLIHPGLFWTFSGQDAVRLTQSSAESELN